MGHTIGLDMKFLIFVFCHPKSTIRLVSIIYSIEPHIWKYERILPQSLKFQICKIVYVLYMVRWIVVTFSVRNTLAFIRYQISDLYYTEIFAPASGMIYDIYLHIRLCWRKKQDHDFQYWSRRLWCFMILLLMIKSQKLNWL